MPKKKKPQDITVLTPTIAGSGQLPNPSASAVAKETWKDWSGPGAKEFDPTELITRDELISTLREVGVEVDVKDLLFWQGRGVVPYPTKIRRGRLSYAYYAPWVSGLIYDLRLLQNEGKTLEEIGGILRGIAKMRSIKGYALRPLIAEDDLHRQSKRETNEDDRVAEDHGALTFNETVTITRSAPVTIALSAAPKGFAHLAAAIAGIYEDEYGTKIKRVEIGLTDEHGGPLAFAFAMPVSK